VQGSAAKKKRQPFVVRNGERTHNVYCCQHADELATFYCAICHKPYGEECVSEERGEKSICIVCADSKLKRDIEKVNKKKNIRRVFMGMLGIIATIILTINIFVMIKYSSTSELQNKPKLTQQVSALIECRHRLENLAKHASSFQEAFGHPPESLEDLRNLVDNPALMLEPETGVPFLILSDKQHQVKIICPHPEAHGLAALYAVPGRPARMVYVDNQRSE
jgi:hypothetical protein